MSKVILTATALPGPLHVGHYVGSLKRRVELQNSGEYDKIFIMIADAQALTDNADNPEKVRQNIIEVALDYLSCGLDPAKSTLFIQSQIPELCELSFYYMNLVTVSRLQRNPTVKSEIQMRNFETSIPGGLFYLSYQPGGGYYRVPCHHSSGRRGSGARLSRRGNASTSSIPYMGKHLQTLISCCLTTRYVCACRVLTGRQR